MSRQPHLLIINAPYYRDVSDNLLKNTKIALDEARATYEVRDVPGALEIPAAIKFASQSGKFDGYVALGCVIRGETTHYDYVCTESAHGLQVLAMQHGLCIGNGILTVESKEQALARALGSAEGGKDKGRDAALAPLALIKLKAEFSSGPIA